MKMGGGATAKWAPTMHATETTYNTCATATCPHGATRYMRQRQMIIGTAAPTAASRGRKEAASPV